MGDIGWMCMHSAYCNALWVIRGINIILITLSLSLYLRSQVARYLIDVWTTNWPNQTIGSPAYKGATYAILPRSKKQV